MSKTDPRDWDMFRDIAAITRWLDAANPNVPGDSAMRVLKISEEIREAYEVLGSIAIANGRAATAYIGYTGQNPRKGITHTDSDLCMELADVAITALCAIAHFTGNNPDIVRAYLAAKISGIIGRADIPPLAEELCEPIIPDPTVTRLAAMNTGAPRTNLGERFRATGIVVTREPTTGEEMR